MGSRWRDEPDPVYPPIVGWWTIGDAPNYEINDDGVVRHKTSKQIIKQHDNGKGTDYRTVTLNAYGRGINRSVKALVEKGRKYQER